MRLDQSRYERGDVRCSKCGIWIPFYDVSKETFIRKSDNTRVHKECNHTVRMKGRTQLSTIRRSSNEHRSPIKFSRKYHMRSDILLNKDKWEKLISTKNPA